MVADMPIQDRLQNEYGSGVEGSESEESVADDRAGMRPSQCVQEKFLTHTRDIPVPVSSLHTGRSVRR
jgi:hypothetical protein